MITVISGTNRYESETLKYAEKFCEILAEQTSKDQVQLLSLTAFSGQAVHSEMYQKDGQHDSVAVLQDKYIEPIHKWLIVAPEYNGSFPGVLKAFIDACSVRNYQATFSHKKAALVGISSGKAGNLRGLEHLTGILNYLNVQVMPGKLPISSVETLSDEKGDITDIETIKAMNKLVSDFINF